MAAKASQVPIAPGKPQRFSLLAVTAAVALLCACSDRAAAPGPADAKLEQESHRFVELGLALGQLYPAELDSYFGPEDLRPAPNAPKPPLAELSDQITALQRDLAPEGTGARVLRLQERTARLGALIAQLQVTEPGSFDAEAQSLYGLEPYTPDPQQFARARAELDRLLPGGGSLTSRVQAYRENFIVPEALRPAIFARALAECRARTLQHWPLPKTERLDVEWTSAVDAAWHRYQGNYRSTLQINPQAVAFLGSMIDVACHEGYPGHHAQFLLAEADAGAGGLPIEDRIVLLRSPGSVLREGAADYGVSLVFPAADRIAFERTVLFPMAGFAPEEAARFEQIRALLDQLAPAALPILRAYRDRKLTSEAAIDALDQDALIASPQSLLGFVDNLGAYVAGYTGVREQVRAIVEAGGAPSAPQTRDPRWGKLRCVLQLADQMPLARISKAVSVSPQSCHP